MDTYHIHFYTFRNRVQNSTTLSTHVWDLQDERKKHDIKWELIDRAPEFNPSSRKCRLCDKEKFYIIFQPEGATLNSRSELFSTCRHRKRLLLSKIKPWVSFRFSIQYKTPTVPLVRCRWRLWSTYHMKQIVRPFIQIYMWLAIIGILRFRNLEI